MPNDLPVTLEGAVKCLDITTRRLHELQRDHAKDIADVIECAKRVGINTRTVIIVGKLAWYIDPPTNGNDWQVSFGSPPEELATNREG